MSTDAFHVLKEHGIQPSAQRVAVAEYVLETDDHPSADEVFAKVSRTFRTISRATVYNTLNLFVAEGLLRSYVLTEGRVVFDPNVASHHHFVDEESGRIHDIPWDALEVRGVEEIPGVRDYQVVIRGSRGG